MSGIPQGERRIRTVKLPGVHCLVEQPVLDNRALFEYDPDGFLPSDVSLRSPGVIQWRRATRARSS